MICVETCCTLNNGSHITNYFTNQVKKKSEKLFSLWQFKVTSFITFYASGYPSARESYSAVKKNASIRAIYI